MSAGYKRKMLRVCIALWLFAFLAGASYAMGSHDDGPRMAHAGLAQ